MVDSDSTADVSLRAAKTPILGATFYIQAYDETQLHKDIAEFCHFNLFQGMSKPFIFTIADILRMFDDGWAVLEIVMETREWSPRRRGANRKKYTMLKKLAPRPVSTISEIKYDDHGGPIAIVQQAIRGNGRVEEVEIPIEKLLIFTFNQEGGDIQGKPLLRTAYGHWYFKRELYKIDAIGHERNHLGVPVWSLAAGFSAKDVESAWEQVTNIRTNERTGAVEPPGHRFRFERPEGNIADILPSIEHHDNHILLNVMAQFLMLGLTGGGGRATSGAHVDMFQKAMRYLADYIAGVFNLYLIPRLVGYNFDVDAFPELRVRNIGETKDLQAWAAAHANLISQGAVVVDDKETENWYRENLDMPLRSTDRPTVHSGDPTGRGSVAPDHPLAGGGDSSVPPGYNSVEG